MKSNFLFIAFLLSLVIHSFAAVTIDDEAFGKSLGGWKKREKATAEYPLSGADYRTYKPETSPTPDGGIFISVRIDHVRGWLASDDHAILEITVGAKGAIVSAQSTIAIQGQSIKSDVILGSNDATKAILSPEVAVQVGTDLVANLSAKLLRENIVEAGRVSFPAALRHNYNHLYQSLRVDGVQVLPVAAAPPPSTSITLSVNTIPAPASVPDTPPAIIPPPVSLSPAVTPAVTPPPAAPVQPQKPKDAAPSPTPLDIKPYG